MIERILSMKQFQTWAEVDLDAFHSNLDLYRDLSHKTVMIVVKANAYGHGDAYMSRCANTWGYDHFAVSSLEEAIHLRNNGVTGMILILGAIIPGLAHVAIQHDLSVTVPSMEFVTELYEDLHGLKCHIKVDTGMNRIGFHDADEIREAIEILESRGASVEGIFSHYATADEPEKPMMNAQFLKFRETVNSLDHSFRYIHMANSDGVFHNPDETFTNMIRPGIGLYGYADHPDLKPVLSLYSSLTLVKKVHAGETVGYGASYTASHDEWIGTMPIGYADGWDRKNASRYVSVGGEICPFAGRICMDQSMIRLPYEIPVHTPVELFGKDIPLTVCAKELDTIPHEILCRIAERIPRFYTSAKKTVHLSEERFHYDL
ncbi:MAG: alanine racemase [Erysipelotrichales bacterium]|nr:alanine racemase [Erysipelotrichales bacterium]